MNLIALIWTNVNKKPAISNGFLDFLGLLWILLDSLMVEAAGVEPASENLPLELLRT